jgi:hypothetical protein
MKITGLDESAVLFGTDKSSVEHDYARQYERAFAPLKEADIDLLEIGVASGASLRMWEQFFPNARLVGVDIIDDCRRHAGERRIIEIGSQIDPEFLDGLMSKYSPTIIIDDGSHIAEHIEFTFNRLFPKLRPGGCYVIEDLNFHIIDSKPAGALQFALNLAFATIWSSRSNSESLTSIERVEFMRHGAMIWKRVPDPDPNETIRNMGELIKRSRSASNWFSFVVYARERGADLDIAENAARESIALGMGGGLAHWRLSETLEAKGDLKAALAAAEEAYARSRQNSHIKERVDRLARLIVRA